MIRRGDKLICPDCKGCEIELLVGGPVRVHDGDIVGANPSWFGGTFELHGNRGLCCRLCGYQTTVARARKQL